MPPPIATAGRGTRGRTDTAWQSVIALRVPEHARAVNSTIVQLAAVLPDDYHRSSMVREATTRRDRPAGAAVAPITPIAFIASKRR